MSQHLRLIKPFSLLYYHMHFILQSSVNSCTVIKTNQVLVDSQAYISEWNCLFWEIMLIITFQDVYIGLEV